MPPALRLLSTQVTAHGTTVDYLPVPETSEKREHAQRARKTSSLDTQEHTGRATGTSHMVVTRAFMSSFHDKIIHVVVSGAHSSIA